MRLALAGIPAALITLVLFVLMQAMVALPDRVPGQRAARNPVSILSSFAPVRDTRDAAPAARSLPSPASPPPPLPEFNPPALVQPAALAPSAPATALSPAELPLDLGRLVLPKPSPAPTPPARRQVSRQAAQPPVPATRRPSPKLPVATAPSATQQVTKLDAPAEPRSGTVVGRADPVGREGREQAGDDPVEAVPVVRVEPEYPRKAARAGHEGWVKLAFTITPSGGVTNVRVLESRPRRVFDRVARRALEQWRFRPQRIDGRAQAREAVQVIEFKLANRG